MQVRDQLEVLQAASGQLRACSDFMVLLRAVLTLGNHLNEGTMRGAASGGAFLPCFGRRHPWTYTQAAAPCYKAFQGHLSIQSAAMPCDAGQSQ